LFLHYFHVKKKKFAPTDIIYIDKYDLSSVAEQVEACGGWENYKGQVFYWNGELDDYNLCPFDPVLEDMITEAQVKKFKHSTATDNFLASHLLITGNQ